jgi:hypothetical protein
MTKKKNICQHSSSSDSDSNSLSCKKKCTLKNLDCKIIKFKLSNYNILFDCNNFFPCLLKGYIKMLGNVPGLRSLSSKSNDDLCDSSDINNYFISLPAYFFNNKRYNIRLTIVYSDGKVYFDNLLGVNKSHANNLDNHNTRLEIINASNTKWGSMERTSNSNDIRYKYYAIWIPECIQSGFNEVLCFRFALKININGDFISDSP